MNSVIKSVVRAGIASRCQFSLFRQPVVNSSLVKNIIPTLSFSSHAATSASESAEVDDFEPVIVKEALKTQFRERSIDEFGRSYGTGRRKTSVARVWIKEGAGQVSINGRSINDYFQFHLRQHAMEAMELTETAGHFDMMCTVKGGGVSGQAGAIRLGIARALEAFEPNLRPLLKTRKLSAVMLPRINLMFIHYIHFCCNCRRSAHSRRQKGGEKEDRPEEGQKEIPVGQEISGEDLLVYCAFVAYLKLHFSTLGTRY
jgi:small subunit ribosomal protein S9